MQAWLASSYLWIKAIHIVAVISWMAGLLYLPRLFVYHCQVEVGSVSSELFKVMERRLATYIMTPALVVSVVCGLGLLLSPGVWARSGASLSVKLVLVGLLCVAHVCLLRWQKAFARDSNSHSERFFRVVNEVPTLLMIGIVIAVVVRPWN